MAGKIFSYFPGCSLSSTGVEYEMSTKAVAEKLGITLEEIEDWPCCGASSAHMLNREISVELPVRALVKAKQDTVLTVCAACYSRLSIANREMKEDEEIRDRINKKLKTGYSGDVAVRHLLEILNTAEMREQIVKEVKAKLDKLKIACYYGCLLVRPASVAIDDVENPTVMDTIVSLTGAGTVDWGYKTECCGAGLNIPKGEIVVDLVHKIISGARSEGANCIVVACPLCHVNLEIRQPEIAKKYNVHQKMPVFYFTQILGLAFGLSAKELGINRHLVDAVSFVKEKIG